MLEMYFQIRGLDIIIQMSDGSEILLDKNRMIIDDMIVIIEKGKKEKRIPLSDIKAVDLYAA